jgi:hypothetical protein
MTQPKKMHFSTPEELHTSEYNEYVKWMANIWLLNDRRNKRIEKEKLDLIEKSRPEVSDEMLDVSREIASRIWKERPGKTSKGYLLGGYN